ncbi:MAG: collagenase, partial [Sarcina sp.]
GGNVTQEKVKKLYWAAKEVRAQFIRMVGSDRPLSQGNADDTLTTVVYNSPDEYKLNLRLYGHPTNNGGIYIETEGNFYTYERTTQQSRFSLEELFRHEYTHYLQGRYLVPGMWGRGGCYDNGVEKLTWYDEGNAEFFAGSTRTEGVKPRRSIIEYLTNRSLPHIGTVLRSKYSSSNFYNTSCAIFLYMYNNNLGMFRTINSYIRADDVTAYDNYINVLANDNNLNTLYRQWTNDLTQNIATLTVPMVSDDYILRHQRTSQQQIQRDIESVIRLGSVRVTTSNSQFFTTIVVKGTYNAGRAYGEITDWQTMNRTVDRALEDLSRRPWTGYKTFTAYFTEYRADSGYATFMVTFHGVLNII